MSHCSMHGLLTILLPAILCHHMMQVAISPECFKFECSDTTFGPLQCFKKLKAGSRLLP